MMSLPTSGISAALLYTRSSPKLARADDWDAWEVDKHMYDLVRGPGVTSATMYKRTVDEGLPQALTAEPRRSVVYRAPDLVAMRLWLESDVLAEAVEDGRTWIDDYDPLEDQWFTGNVYSLRVALGKAPPLSSYILTERFEVPAALVSVFEQWLDSYVPRLAELSGIESVQSFDVARDISNVLYLSQGNYAVQLTVPAHADPIACLTTAKATRAFRSSQDWELRLGYQTRELFTPAGHSTAPDTDETGQ